MFEASVRFEPISSVVSNTKHTQTLLVIAAYSLLIEMSERDEREMRKRDRERTHFNEV